MEASSEVVQVAVAAAEPVAVLAAASDSVWLHGKTKEIEENARIHRTFNEKLENKPSTGKVPCSAHRKSLLRTTFRI